MITMIYPTHVLVVVCDNGAERVDHQSSPILLFPFHRVGDVRVTHGRQCTDNLLVHPYCGYDTPCLPKKKLSLLKAYPSEIDRKISACGEDGSTCIHLLLEEGRKQVNRGEEPVTEDLVVETGYVAGKFMNHSFT